MGYLLLHESENDGRNLYQSFEITFDNVPCAKVLEIGFKVSLNFLESLHYNNFAVLFLFCLLPAKQPCRAMLGQSRQSGSQSGIKNQLTLYFMLHFISPF